MTDFAIKEAEGNQEEDGNRGRNIHHNNERNGIFSRDVRESMKDGNMNETKESCRGKQTGVTQTK